MIGHAVSFFPPYLSERRPRQIFFPAISFRAGHAKSFRVSFFPPYLCRTPNENGGKESGTGWHINEQSTPLASSFNPSSSHINLLLYGGEKMTNISSLILLIWVLLHGPRHDAKRGGASSSPQQGSHIYLLANFCLSLSDDTVTHQETRKATTTNQDRLSCVMCRVPCTTSVVAVWAWWMSQCSHKLGTQQQQQQKHHHSNEVCIILLHHINLLPRPRH